MNRPNPPDRKRRAKRGLIGVLAALAVALGLLWRGCFGFGGGEGSDDGEATQARPDARASTDATPAPTICELRLDSTGLSLNGKPVEVADAVEICRALGQARLRVTGGARSGTYDELKQAFEQAGIALDVRDGRVN